MNDKGTTPVLWFSDGLLLLCMVICFVVSFGVRLSLAQTADQTITVHVPTEHVLGINYSAIRAAEPEFERRGFDLKNYRIVVHTFHDIVYVTLEDPGVPLGLAGRSPPYPEVQLRRSNFELLKSYFVRHYLQP